MKKDIDEKELSKGLNNIIADGIFSQGMATLTQGVILAAFALELGASNLIIGLLATIGPVSQLIQIPSIYLVEKVRKRKLITVLSAVISRFFILPIIFNLFFG